MVSRLTAQSEYGKIEELLIKGVDAAFLSQAHIESQWKQLNFTAAPDFDQSLTEYAFFESVLAKYVDKIHHLPTTDTVTLDSLYCRDAILTTDYGIICCQMGKPDRQSEPSAIKAYCEQNNLNILGEIFAPGTLEGGDLAWIDEHSLAVGHTYRTNAEGIEQLRRLLLPYEVELIVAELPHYKGPSDVFHLMSIFSPIDRDLAVVYSPLMPIAFRNKLLDRDFHLIEVPDFEFESMGCNVLALAPRVCMMVAGNPITAQTLRSAGCTVYEYGGNEISLKGGGGPTCLTRPLKRRMLDSGFY